ncbi:MAG TPA: hypothetical protein VF950_04520 [Planctomycetota bacterium]
MKTPSGVAEAVDQLTAEGYPDTFRAELCGMRAAALAGCCHPPEDVRVERAYRFEGDSTPDEQVVVFALRCMPHGNAGTYVVPHGPETPALDAEALPRLIDARPFVTRR